MDLCIGPDWNYIREEGPRLKVQGDGTAVAYGSFIRGQWRITQGLLGKSINSLDLISTRARVDLPLGIC